VNEYSIVFCVFCIEGLTDESNVLCCVLLRGHGE